MSNTANGISSIGILSYKEKSEVSQAMNIITRWAADHPQITLYTHQNLEGYISEHIQLKNDKYLQTHTDLILSLGGDGTYLAAARQVCERHIPVLGINLGKLGFLSDVSLDVLPSTLNQIVKGEYTLAERLMLKVQVFHKGKKVFEDMALNDAVIKGKMGSELIELQVTANDKFLTNYWADGLIIATPTGSTAYSLSAGGPIIYPLAQTICLTPLNPKSLSVRPMILPVESKLQINSLNPQKRSVKMAIDGRNELRIYPGHIITITKHEISSCVLMPKDSSFFESIRNKLGWTGYHNFKGLHAT